MASLGESEVIGAAFGAPEITTRGGAGDVLSETGDRRGVVGPTGVCPLTICPLTMPSELEDWDADRLGAVREGDDGPGEFGLGMADGGLIGGGGFGDLVLDSPDFILDRFCKHH